ncbi:hypothetical protein GGQ68_002334 [Sagittula marina]|uniref:Uncharacterized protein n=1 Tax=Sagittula marina TaxID=943940 RepID=A0A7W6GS28_9RHOB|nr:hypothetical protein [Sagittula marina]MBB3985996.1 hypothetical protein [Sagittula marina]
MRALAISVILAACAASSASAEKGALAYCQDQANGIAYSGGAKTGYAAQYNAAVDACMNGRASYTVVMDQSRFRQPRNTPSVVGNCPPGAAPFYRGTLYCVD